jgi:hypothetical protein
MPFSRWQTRLMIATVAGVLAACGDSGTGPGDGPLTLGSGSAQVNGAVSRNFSGIALFATDVLIEVTGERNFGLAIEDLAGTSEVTVGFTGEGRPPAGTYPLAGPETSRFAEARFTNSSGQDEYFASLSGTLTITASTAQSLQGTVSFQARREFGGQGEISVTASFNATCVATAFSCD